MTYPFFQKGTAGNFTSSVSDLPLQRFDISPILKFSKVENGVYYLKFDNMCHANQVVRGNIVVDQKVLKTKLENWIRLEDRKYIKLASFNTSHSVFAFDADVWLDDAVKNSTSSVNFSTFAKTYRLTRQLPYMIRVYGLNMAYEKYIAKTFKERIKKLPKTREDVFSMITSVTGKTLALDKLDMFEYNYLYSSNSIMVSLKPLYFGSVMAMASNFFDKKEKKQQKSFEEKVGLFLSIRK